MKAVSSVTLLLLLASVANAHEGHSHEPPPLVQEEIVRLNTEPPQQQLVVLQQGAAANQPELAKLFVPFKETVNVRFNKDYLFVESNGMPAHPMMIGITAWQQQVPLPQTYSGDNAWRIPLHPVPARQPKSTKEHFFRGAIALAVNGVPIFNPIKNDGKTDTSKAGELDQWGGHCGRADDYHYHIAPVHLEEIVGAGNPVAVALDGYPIYGYNDPNGKPPTDLDWLNGHKGPDGSYHYHATKTFPYLNGGFYGEIVERNGQVDPQPRARPLRPSLTGLKGAKITGFENPKPDTYVVRYDVNGDQSSVEYTVASDGSATFNFVSQQGTTTETYTPRERREGGTPGRRSGAPSPEEKRAPRREPPAKEREGERRGGQQRQRGQRRGGGQVQGDETPRQPWILVHADEIDLNRDGIIGRDEIVDEAEKAFGSYDANKNGELSDLERKAKGNVRSAMAGFLRGHANELDRNGDGLLTRKEVVDNATKMFSRMDSNEDGKITKTELEASRRTDDSTDPGGIRVGQPDSRDKRLEKRGWRRNGQRGDQRKEQAGGKAGLRDEPPSKLTASPSKTPATSVSTNDLPTASSSEQQSPRTGPNFVFFLIDDMGWRDMGFSGNEFIETPNTDRIAREGIIFRQAYSSAPNCAPSRACIMSGQYPPRHGIYTVVDERHAPGSAHHKILAAHSNDRMDTDVVTIAECLRDAGYATGAFGMWNLGRGRSGPSTATGQGFDIYKKPQDCGFDQHDYFDRDGNFITDVLTNEGIEFIENNQNRPFFLYLPYHAIHAPFQPKADRVAHYERKSRALKNGNVDPVYAAMIDVVDQNVGRIMDRLKQLNLDEHTMVIFTSDNGGTPRFVAPLNGSKGALYEGGIRVPACVWWSGIKNTGRTCDTPILGMDFYPTMLDAANISLPKQKLDGVSFLPVLQDTGSVERDAVFWHFPSYVGRSAPSSAIRMGDWKLIENYEDRSIELYNLVDDIGESRNLATLNFAKANELYTRLKSWQKAMGAAIPSVSNPNYDPAAIRGWRRGGQRRDTQKRGPRK